MKYFLLVFIVISFFSCSECNDVNRDKQVVSRSEYYFDESRKRTIPMELYENTEDNYENGLVVINAGYGCSNTEYTYLARFLGLKNYLVVALHHEHQSDEMLPSGDNLYELRLPNWDQGVFNIQAILKYMKAKYPSISNSKINLIGHSNGGDISALYATKFPNKVNSLITLDHRRMPLPRTNEYMTLSFRADEFEADEGVLPSKDELKSYKMKIIQLKNVGHNFLRDNGTEKMKKTIISEIDKIL